MEMLAQCGFDLTNDRCDADIVNKFVVMLAGQSCDGTCGQVFFALGEIAARSPADRDLIVRLAMDSVLQVIRNRATLAIARNGVKLLRVLCSGKPPPELYLVKPALPTLAQYIRSNDEEILTDACGAIASIADGPNDRIQTVIETEICPRLVELLSHASLLVGAQALRAVGNIVTGDEAQTDVVLQSGALPALANLLQHSDDTILKEVCWTISNITAGSTEQLQRVIDGNIVPLLIEMLQSPNAPIKKEAAWAISNAASGGTEQQRDLLVHAGCIEPMLDLLSDNDVTVVSVSLECLGDLLRHGEKERLLHTGRNPIVTRICAAEGLPDLRLAANNPLDDISEKAQHMLETYFADMLSDESTKAPDVVITVCISEDGKSLVLTTLSGDTIGVDADADVSFRELKCLVAGTTSFAPGSLRFAAVDGRLLCCTRADLSKVVSVVLRHGSS